jgi:hypothetical protein
LRLKDFWARQLDKRLSQQISVERCADKGADKSVDRDREKFDRVIIDGLGLALEETMKYLLQEAPDFDRFENWILDKNDGRIDRLRIEKINCVTENIPYGSEFSETIRAIEDSEPVLSIEDLKFWDKNGYVILRDAIAKDEAEASEQAVWQFLEMDPEKPSMWYSKNIGKGIMTEFYHHPALNKNRGSKRIHKAFSQLWRTADLMVTTDRTGFNPPETNRWKFPGPQLHWDIDLSPPFHFGVQGLLYLCDTPAEQGAFSCVRGFHKDLESWLESLPAGVSPREIDLDEKAVPIAGKAGDLIIWHHFLPHGSSPNRGIYPRIVQYLTMYPFLLENTYTWK